MSLRSPHPSVGTTQESHTTAVLTQVSHPSSTLSTVHTCCPFLGSVGSESPLHPPIQIYCSPWALDWSAGVGEGQRPLPDAFRDSGRIFISERVHCRPQPRSQQGVEQEGSFKQRQTLLGLVGIPRAPVELQRVLLGWLCCTGKLFRFERCWLNH